MLNEPPKSTEHLCTGAKVSSKTRWRSNQAAGSHAAGQQTPPEAPLVKLSNEGAETKWAGATSPQCRALTCSCLRTARQKTTLYTHKHWEAGGKKENARAARLARRRKIKNTNASNGAWSKETPRICASLHFRTVCFVAFFFFLCLFEECAL